MWEKIFDLALQNGLWAVLFMFLLIYELKDSNKREKKYQETIESLNQNLSVVKEIKDDVVELKSIVLTKNIKKKSTQMNICENQNSKNNQEAKNEKI